MKASRFEFRFRYAIHVAVFVLCFTAPWDAVWSRGGPSNLWSALSGWVARTGALSFGTASVAFALLGIALAFAGAWLRTWGSAYLGADVVEDKAMHGAAIVADGPYRHLRNPLYLGTWLHTLGLSLLMPPLGGIAAVALIGVFQLRLIGAEEAYLAATLGASYTAYCARVPSLLPSIQPRLPASGGAARWLPSLVSESYFWFFAVGFSVLAWRYDALLLDKSVLVELGVSLVLNAAFPAKKTGHAQGA